jgi:hypothetical protein
MDETRGMESALDAGRENAPAEVADTAVEAAPVPADGKAGRKQFADMAAALGLKTADPDKLPVVLLRPDLASVARLVGQVVSRLDLFRTEGGELVFFDDEGKRQLMLPRVFRTWIQRHCITARRYDKESGEAQSLTMEMDEAATILAAPDFMRGVRVLRGEHRVRLPVLREGGGLDLLPWGYDAETGIYTIPGGLEYDLDVDLAAANGHFDRAFGTFPMSDGRSRAVQAAAMLAVYVRMLPGGQSLRPGIIWLANKPESGKSVLAKAAQYHVFGRAPAAKLKRNEDLDKEMEAFMRAGVPAIFLDNVYGGLESQTLDQLLTTEESMGRAMGGHGIFEAKNRAQFFVTGNNLKLNDDAVRRFLIVDLFEPGDPKDRQMPPGGLLNDDAMRADAWRKAMLAMCWAWVRHWHAAGMPVGTHRMGSFEEFSLLVGGIVEAAGYEAPCAPAAIPDAINPEQAEFRRLMELVVQEMGLERQRDFSIRDMARMARAMGVFEPQVGTQEDGKALTIKNEKLSGEMAMMAEDRGFLNDRQNSSFAKQLRKRVGQETPTTRGLARFGKREQARNSTWTVELV